MFFNNLNEEEKEEEIKNREIITEMKMSMDIIDFYKFRQIMDNRIEIPKNEILLFENCDFLSSLHRYKIPIFRNCIIAIFNNTSKEFNDTFITNRFFPNIKKIYINTEFSSTIFYHRFPKEVWITTFFYYVPRNYNICTNNDFEANINYFKNKFYNYTYTEKVKNILYNNYTKAKYYVGIL